jgi:hypothetical protein
MSPEHPLDEIVARDHDAVTECGLIKGVREFTQESRLLDAGFMFGQDAAVAGRDFSAAVAESQAEQAIQRPTDIGDRIAARWASDLGWGVVGF